MVAASILPIAWHEGEWRVLFGKECELETSAKGWSDFGGRVDDFDPTEPKRRAAFRILESAAREGMEETTAFLGDARYILQRLVEYGARYSGADDRAVSKLFSLIDQDQDHWTPPEISPIADGEADEDEAADNNNNKDRRDDRRQNDSEPTQRNWSLSATSAQSSQRSQRSQKRRRSDRSGSTKRRRRYRTPTPAADAPFSSSSAAASAVSSASTPPEKKENKKGSALSDTTDLSDIWRPVWDDPDSPDPTRDWDCLEKSGYYVFFYPMEYDENLVHAFNANHALLWNRLDKKMLAKTKLFEKCEMRWFTLADMKRERSIFRKFYQPIADAIRKRLESQVPSSLPEK